jgi:hypothetical protein
MPTARASGFQGYDPELAQIRIELERLADGEETGIIVEGAVTTRRWRGPRTRLDPPTRRDRPPRCLTDLGLDRPPLAFRPA